MSLPTSRLLVLVCLVVVFSCAIVWAQRTTGSLGGVVQDPSGGVIPGASVTVTQEATGVSRTAVTDETGSFTIPYLSPGSYTLKVEITGFKTHEQTGIPIESARDFRGTFVLQVGQMTETVTVHGAASLVNTVSAEQRLGLDINQIEALPNPNRNITNLLGLNPAVTVVTGNDHRGARLNGMGRHASSYTMDGIDASGSTEGNIISQYSGTNRIDLISTEGIQEVQIIKGVVPAEYGNTVSGQVNIITKSGTNEIHGSLFHLYQTSGLNAQDPFLTSKPKLVYNQFGGSAGFPILKRGFGPLNQLFGFVAYEGYRETRGVRKQWDVPTQAAREQLFASPNLTDREKQILHRVVDILPFPNQPNAGALGGQFVTARGRIGEDDTILVKGDLHFKDGSLLAFTWNRLDPSFTDPHIVPEDDRTWFDSADRYAASWLKGKGRWALESRFGWSEVDQARLDKLFSLGRDPTNPNETIPYTRRLPIVNTPDWATLSDSEVWTTDSTTFNLDQKIGYVRSSHSIKFGGAYQYKSGNRTNPECPSFEFQSFDDLLANRPNRVTYTFGEPNHNGRVFQFGFFVQDDWKVRRNFTLNLGVRYDFISNFTANRIEDDGPRSTGRGVELTALNLEPPTDWTKFDFGKPLPASKPFKHDAVNIGPRFGFNWDLSGEGKTVVRGGYGLMYAPNTIAVLRDVVQELFIPRRFRFLSKGETEQFGVRVGVLNGEARDIVRSRALSGGFNPIPFTIYNPFLDAPYTQNYTLGIERRLLQDTVIEIDYVGQRGTQFEMTRDVNQPDRVTGLRPNPNLVGVSFYLDDTQQSVYNALQVALKKRFSKNLAYGITYAYGRAIATGGSDTGARFGSDNIENCCQDFENPREARGRVPADVEHNFTANWYYQLPFFRTAGAALRDIAGGWSISGILRAQTGTPLGVSQSGGRGINRPDIVLPFSEARFDNYRETLQYLNPAAFAKVPLNAKGIPIRPGGANRSLFDRPGFWAVDMSFGKEFAIREQKKLRFQWDWFNAFNHVNLGGPRTNFSGSRFGRIEGLGGSMRITQLNMKLLF